jgi:GxxExxY protein
VKHIDEISRDVIGVAMRIHRELGPGLYENVYETILAGKLAELGFVVDRQKPVDIEFEGTHFPAAFKIDLLIDHRLIVEIKSVDQPTAAHAQQRIGLFAAIQTTCRLGHQFWGSHTQRRCQKTRQRSP